MVIPPSAWSDAQKAALVQQIVSGGLTLERACAQYGLSVDEIKDWVCVFRRSVRQAVDRQLRSTLSLRGLEVEELNRPEFSGELSALNVSDLLQTIQPGRKDAHALRCIADPSLVFGVVSSIAARHARDLGPEEMAVLSLFDGVRSLEQVLSVSALPEREVLEIAAGFLEQGILRVSPRARTDFAAARAATTGSMAMSYHPVVGTVKPAVGRPPAWVLASGALLCSSLGAVTAIAYADALDRSPTESALPVAALAAMNSISARALALCPEGMVLIRGGKFFMGSDSNHPALQYASPAHPVSVDSFCMGIHEVSVREYDACVAQGACEPAHDTSELRSSDTEHAVSSTSRSQHDEQCNIAKPGREHDPINCVSYGQAREYCAFRTGRLATEAEWEFAARGENNRLFPWGNTQPTADHVNTCGKECARWHEEVGLASELHGLMYDEDDGYAGTAPVGSYPLGATSDGVLDLIGNVFEWTSGGLYPYERSARVNPRGPSNSGSYVIRGGNFNSGTPEFSDPALRFALPEGAYSHGVGIRCASDPEFSPGGRAGARP